MSNIRSYNTTKDKNRKVTLFKHVKKYGRKQATELIGTHVAPALREELGENDGGEKQPYRKRPL
jgi:hypothetical protein